MWHFSYSKWFQCKSPHKVHIDKSCTDTVYFRNKKNDVQLWCQLLDPPILDERCCWRHCVMNSYCALLWVKKHLLHLVDSLYLTSGLVHVPCGTLVSEELSCIVDHSRLILLLSAHWAGFPPRKPLKGLQTCPVENMRARQQHLKGNMRICLSIWEVQSWTHVMKPEAAAKPNLELRFHSLNKSRVAERVLLFMFSLSALEKLSYSEQAGHIYCVYVGLKPC